MALYKKGGFMSKLFSFLFPFLTVFLFSCSHVDPKEIPVISTNPIPMNAVISSSGKLFYTGLKIPQGFKPKNVRPAYVKGEELPAAFDWRDKVELMPIRSQGSCGSCWSFSTVATFEDSRRIQGEKEDLSEQYLVSCNNEGWSCNGGFFAYDYMMAPKGGISEASYPYTATDSACKGGLNYGAKIKSWAYLPGGDNAGDNINEMKAAIFKYGPIGVGVAVDSNFSNYSGGIFKDTGYRSLNHAVNIVGWNDAEGGYWIMRNSWGNWGENGFMRIAYKANGIGAWSNYVVYEKDPNPNPDPTPDPKPNPDPQPCSPKPYADTGYGDSITVKNGASILMGTKPRAGHRYYWTASPAFDNGAVPQEAQIKYKPRVTKRLTVHAVTQCGEATDSVTVKLLSGYLDSSKVVPELD
jgi:hypothetical protein